MDVWVGHGNDHHDDDDSSGQELLLTWKLILGACIVISSILGVALPKLFLKYGNSTTILCLCNAFAGGVVFGVALIHLLPEATEEWAELYPDLDLPIIMYACCFGFMILIFIENLVVQHGSFHDEEEECQRLNEAVSGKGDEEDKKTQEGTADIFTSYTLMCALCFHSVIEGFALGMLTDFSDLILVFIAIIAHKAVAAFALGTSMAKAEMETFRYVAMSSIFTLSTPLGMLIAILILAFAHPNDTVSDTITLITEGVASGTFLFIATMEIFTVEFRGCHLFLPKFFLALAGIIIMALVSLYS